MTEDKKPEEAASADEFSRETGHEAPRESDQAEPADQGELEAPSSADAPADEQAVSEAGDGKPQTSMAQDAEPSAGADEMLDERAAAASEPGAAREAEAPAPVKAKGRGLAVLALFFALTAAGGVGYLYYELVYLAPLNAVTARSAELDVRYTSLETQLTAAMDEVAAASRQAVAELAETQEARLAENEAAVVKSLNEALVAAPPSQREWKLAEAEYLMRIANHRVLMEQDTAGALELLMAADRIIAELDDFALHQVRARLADEIIALEQVRRDDLQGIYLRLEALKSQLDTLPLVTPAYLEDARPEPDTEQTVWASLAEELKQFVRIRDLGEGEAIKPLLAPEEERYLELNLRLALEQAQLAVLKRQQTVFEQSLASVRDWFERYMEPGDERTQAVLETVDELLQIDLARPLPDISGSLNELLTAGGGAS